MEDLYVPTMFKRDPKTRLVIPEFNDGCEWVLQSTKSRLTLMLDGYCYKIVTEPGQPWQSYRRQRLVQDGRIITNWIKMDRNNPEHKRFWDAYNDARIYRGGIYELIGPDIKGNPHGAVKDNLVAVIPASYALCPSTTETKISLFTKDVVQLYNTIKEELEHPESNCAGVVIQEEEWVQTEHKVHRACKVKKRDFGIPWPPPVKKAAEPEPVKATVPATVVNKPKARYRDFPGFYRHEGD